jgi:predicted ATPase
MEEPYRERLHAQLMLALYRDNRQADALAVYRDARARLVDDLGIEPGSALQALNSAILDHDPALALGTTETARPARSQTQGGRRGSSRVPAETTPLFGRDQEVAQSLDLLSWPTSRLVTLTGPGGVGKTRLALAVARVIAEQGTDVDVVELAPIADPAHVRSAIAAVLAHDADADWARLLSTAAAADRDRLIVLDNFEHVLDAAVAVRELLDASSTITVLATSRQPLELSVERVFPVAPLALPGASAPRTEVCEAAAVAMLVDRATARDPSFTLNDANADAVARICTRLDGLPLALELAAAHLRALTPDGLADRLEHALPLLVGGARDAPRRHQALRDTIAWSHDLLDADQRKAFRGMAAFAGSATIDAAVTVTGCHLETVEQLLDRNLLVRRGARVSMLDTIREFAAERLGEAADGNDTRLRHAQYWTHVADHAEAGLNGPDWQAWQRRTLGDVNEFRAALLWSLAHERIELALRMAAGLRGLWAFSQQQPEGYRWLSAALAADRERAPAAVRARALWARAMFPRVSENAGDDAASAFALYEEVGDAAGMSLSLSAASHHHLFNGDRSAAAAAASRAVELAEASGDDQALMWAYDFTVLTSEDSATAQGYLPDALSVVSQTGASWRVGLLLNVVAYAAIEEGRYGQARRLLGQALETVREIEDDQGLPYTLGNQAVASILDGDDVAAANAVESQLATAAQLSETFIGEALLVAAALAAKRERDDDAAALAGMAWKLLNAQTRLGSENAVLKRLSDQCFEAPRQRDHAGWEDAVNRGRSSSREELVETALEIVTSTH